MARGRWIQTAIKKKGALRATAKAAGALKDGISKSWLANAAKAGGTLGKRARLAITLSRLPRPGKVARKRGGTKAAATRKRRK